MGSLRGFRVATFEECAYYGHANLRDHRLLPPIAGSAGIALVKAGTISENSAATVSPAFGQATASTNFLLGCVGWSGANTSATTASGWSKAVEVVTSATVGAAIWFKPNCGAGETAPTFTSSSATRMAAVLSEWSGVATSSPVDQTSGSGTTSGNTNTAADTNASDLAVFIQYDIDTKSATATYTTAWTPSGGTVTAIADDGATKQSTHFIANAYLLNGQGGGAADHFAGGQTLSTGIAQFATFIVASFLPAGAATPQSLITRSRVARNMLLRR